MRWNLQASSSQEWFRGLRFNLSKAGQQSEPEMLMTSMSGKSSWRKSSTFCTPFEIMFIPMASPVLEVNLMYKFLPAIAHCTPCSLANLLDLFIFNHHVILISLLLQCHHNFKTLQKEKLRDEKKRWFWLRHRYLPPESSNIGYVWFTPWNFFHKKTNACIVY